MFVFAQVVLLQRQLGEALAELQTNRERLAEVQAIQVRPATLKAPYSWCSLVWGGGRDSMACQGLPEADHYEPL